MQEKINYYLEFVKQYKEIRKIEEDKPRLLLHVCCGACSCYPLLFLKDLFDITIFYSNSNIYPFKEYEKRLISLKKYVNEFNALNKTHISIIEDTYNHDSFKPFLEKYKDLKEGSTRCQICIALRMKRLFEYAKNNDFKYVTTVMSISRNKDVNYLNFIGEKISKNYPGIIYIYNDFKKNEGQEIGIKIAKKYDVYRQDYCGCEFSFKNYDQKYDLGLILRIHEFNIERIDNLFNSIFSQDIKIPFQLLVILDTKNESLKSYIYEIYNKHSKIIKIIEVNFNDLSESRNYAIKHCTYKYLAFIDENNLLNQNYLSSLYQKALTDNSDIVISSYYINKNNKNKKKTLPVKLLINSNNEALAKKLFINVYLKGYTFNKLFKREFLINNNLFFFSFEECAEEFFFIFTTLLKSNKTSFIKDSLITYYIDKKENYDVSFEQRKYINSYFLCKFFAFKNDKRSAVDTFFFFRTIQFAFEALIHKKELEIPYFTYLKILLNKISKLVKDHYIYEGDDWEKAIYLYDKRSEKELLK